MTLAHDCVIYSRLEVSETKHLHLSLSSALLRGAHLSAFFIDFLFGEVMQHILDIQIN